jgi:hypothetical protein
VTGYSRSPKLLKGAIVVLDLLRPLPGVVVFQYNPESLRRRVTPRAAGEGDARGEPARIGAPPEETISLTIELDATDQLERSDPVAGQLGVAPALASLEILIYPPAGLVIANEVLTRLGMIEVVPPEAPLTLLVWGPKRVLPVRIASLSITEQAFDPNLNPIQASVELELTVLTYNELGLVSAGGALSMAHQVLQEGMAALSTIGTLGATGASVGR